METRYHGFSNIVLIKLVFILFFLSIFSMFFLLAPALAGAAQPAGNLKDAFDSNSGKPLNAVAVQGGGFNTDVTFEIIVSAVITTVLGFMGVIFLVLAIYSGYNWMMARGNEEMVEKSKKTLTNAVIGIVIVLGAYAMVRIIVDVIGSKVFK